MDQKILTPRRMALLAIGLVLLALCMGSPAWAKGYVYITYYNPNMYVVDAANYSLIRATITDDHNQMAASHDGRWLFLAGAHNIWGINTTADPGSSLQKTIPYDDPSESVYDIAVDGDNRIYLVEAGRYIEVYDGNTGERINRRIWTAADSPYRLALSPDGEKLYVAGCRDGGYYIYGHPDYNISAYDADTFERLRTRHIEMRVVDIEASSDGSSLYVLGTNASTGSKKTKLLKLRASDLTIQRTGFGTGSAPFDMAVSRDGDRIYVCERTDNSIQVFDGSTLELERTVAVGDTPMYIDISSDGKKLYISGDNDEFRVVDTDTYEVTHVVMGSMAMPADIEYVDVGPRTFEWMNPSFPTTTPGPSIAFIFNLTTGSATPAPSASASAVPSAPAAAPGPSSTSAPVSASVSPMPTATGETPSTAASPGTSTAASPGPSAVATPGFTVPLVYAGMVLAACIILRPKK